MYVWKPKILGAQSLVIKSGNLIGIPKIIYYIYYYIININAVTNTNKYDQRVYFWSPEILGHGHFLLKQKRYIPMNVSKWY